MVPSYDEWELECQMTAFPRNMWYATKLLSAIQRHIDTQSVFFNLFSDSIVIW